MTLMFASTTGGAPRSAPKILNAARDILSGHGYSALTIEAVAAAAGVGKSTIYRWWPSKEALVGDALAEAFRGDVIPDLDDTRAELRRAVDMTIENYANEDVAVTLPALAADLFPNPELMARFREAFLLRKRENIAVALRRAIQRGDLPADLDTDLLQDVWAGTILYRRLMIGSPLDENLAESLVQLALVSSAALTMPGHPGTPGAGTTEEHT